MINAKTSLLAICLIVAFSVQTVRGADAAIEGALPGVFTLSNGQEIHFSRGNLQYCAATNVWRFAPRQYAVVGESGNGNMAHPTRDGEKSDNLLISPTYDGWIDLFGWGTSGWQSGATAYQPWSTNMDSYDYIPKHIIDDTEREYYNLVGESAMADHGVANPIANGGNMPGLWRTLSVEEWRWLIEERKNASELLGKATVQGARGMVLLPDNWSKPWSVSFTPGYGVEWDTNSFSWPEWQEMEAAGAVFLPCAGHRYRPSEKESSKVIDVQNAGQYWSSSSVMNSKISAFSLYFNSTIYEIYTYDLRSFGLAVRLVTEIQ